MDYQCADGHSPARLRPRTLASRRPPQHCGVPFAPSRRYASGRRSASALRDFCAGDASPLAASSSGCRGCQPSGVHSIRRWRNSPVQRRAGGSLLLGRRALRALGRSCCRMQVGGAFLRACAHTHTHTFSASERASDSQGVVAILSRIGPWCVHIRMTRSCPRVGSSARASALTLRRSSAIGSESNFVRPEPLFARRQIFDHSYFGAAHWLGSWVLLVNMRGRAAPLAAPMSWPVLRLVCCKVSSQGGPLEVSTGLLGIGFLRLVETLAFICASGLSLQQMSQHDSLSPFDSRSPRKQAFSILAERNRL